MVRAPYGQVPFLELKAFSSKSSLFVIVKRGFIVVIVINSVDNNDSNEVHRSAAALEPKRDLRGPFTVTPSPFFFPRIGRTILSAPKVLLN